MTGTDDIDPALALKGFTRETTLFRDAEGHWFHDGEPLAHANLVRAFDRWIERAPDGRYCVKNDINWAYIRLEGPPFFVRGVSFDASGQALLQLSNDRSEPLRGDTLRVGPDGALYCDVGAGDMVARFDRHAAMQLEPLLAEDGQGIYVQLAGQRIRPPVVDNPLQPLHPPTQDH